MSFSTRIKQVLYPLYIFLRVNRRRQRKVHEVFRQFRERATGEVTTSHRDYPLRLFSNLDEDGIILWIMATLGIEKGVFVDIGSNDCINSNCANLALNFNWDGVFIDSQQSQLDIGKRNYLRFRKNTFDRLRFVCSFVTPANINQLVDDNLESREVDLVSIDIDGNDYAIFRALTIIRPKCYVVENKIEFGDHDIVIPPAAENSDAGASLSAMTKLAEEKGYTLVAVNQYGFNSFYLRSDLVSGLLPRLSIESVVNDPVVRKDFYDETVMRSLLSRYNSWL